MVRRRGSRDFHRISVRHDRHGRTGRSATFGPDLTSIGQREASFESIVRGAADYLRDAWTAELEGVTFEVASMPSANHGHDGIDRWFTSKVNKSIVIYRVPVERLSKLHKHDEQHRRLLIEGLVFRATAEYVGREPWDIDPERFGF